MNDNDSNNDTLSPEDDYTAFVVYLRNNGVWKVTSDVFGMLNEIRPEDPIEFFRTNVKTDNDDGRAVAQTRRAIAVAERKIAILKRDRLELTAKLNSLDKRTSTDSKHSSERNSDCGSSDCTEEEVDYPIPNPITYDYNNIMEGARPFLN